MKKIVLLFILFVSLYGNEEGCRVINEVRQEFISLATKKYKIKCIGVRGSFPKKIESIGVLFQVNELLSVDESRLLVVNLVKDFQEVINKSQKIRPLLIDIPFPADRVSISLSLFDGKDFPPPDLFSHVFTSRGDIVYSTHDQDKSIFDQTKIREPLEEACKKTEISIPLIRSSYSEYGKEIRNKAKK